MKHKKLQNFWFARCILCKKQAIIGECRNGAFLMDCRWCGTTAFVNSNAGKRILINFIYDLDEEKREKLKKTLDLSGVIGSGEEDFLDELLGEKVVKSETTKQAKERDWLDELLE